MESQKGQNHTFTWNHVKLENDEMPGQNSNEFEGYQKYINHKEKSLQYIAEMLSRNRNMEKMEIQK